MADRKRVIFSGVFLSVFFISVSGFCQDQPPSSVATLTLNNAISIVFQNNKDIQMQEQEIIMASVNILGAKSAFLPQINLQGSYCGLGSTLVSSAA